MSEIKYDEVMKKLDEYFSNVTEEQFEKDLKEAGYGFYNTDIVVPELEAPDCSATDCEYNEDRRCGARPFINLDENGQCLDYDVYTDAERKEIFGDIRILRVAKILKKLFGSKK